MSEEPGRQLQMVLDEFKGRGRSVPRNARVLWEDRQVPSRAIKNCKPESDVGGEGKGLLF